jgi:sulfite dehydrogenase
VNAALKRRHLLAGTAGALAAASLGRWTDASAQAVAKPLPAYASWKDANALIVHSSSTLEIKRSAFGISVITPSDRLYVRNNLPAPDASILADRDAWETLSKYRDR